MAEIPTPKRASTVVLIRPADGDAFEVFLTRRPPEMEFMGGFYVFPGGTVSEEDCSDEVLGRCRGLSRDEARRILGKQLSPEHSLGHWVAGIRELFEESGILLGVDENGEALRVGEEREKRLAQKREALVEGRIGFRDLLESEGIYCDAGRVAYFWHRITPEKYPIRFDTRFYLARLPADQKPLSFSQEVDDSLWLTPGQVLGAAEEGRLAVIPPTLIALQTLAAIDSWRDLRAKYSL